MTIPQSTFSSIIEALDLANLPVENQEQILLDINELIFKGSLMRLVEKMDEKTRTKFSKLVDANASGEEIEDFIQKNVQDADQVVKDTIDELTNDILAVTSV